MSSFTPPLKVDQDHDDDVPQQGHDVVGPSWLKMSEFNQAVDTILSSDAADELYEATMYVRKVLSVETNPALNLVCSKDDLVEALCDLVREAPNQNVQFEAAWAVTNIASGENVHCAKVIQHGAHEAFVAALPSGNANLAEQCIWGLGNIAGDSSAGRDLVLDAGALPLILDLLPHSKDGAPTVSQPFIRNSCWTLSNLCRGKPQPEWGPDMQRLMGALARVVVDVSSPAGTFPWQCVPGDKQSASDALWGLSYLTSGDNVRIQALMELNAPGGAAAGVLRNTVLLSSGKSPAATPAVRTIGNLVSGTDLHTQAVLDAGFLAHCPALLKSPKATVVKETCWALSNITAGTQAQRLAVMRSAWFMPCMVHVVAHQQPSVFKEACWAMSNALGGANADVTAACLKAHLHTGLLAGMLRGAAMGDDTCLNVAGDGMMELMATTESDNAALTAVKAWTAVPAIQGALQRLAGSSASEKAGGGGPTMGHPVGSAFLALGNPGNADVPTEATAVADLLQYATAIIGTAADFGPGQGTGIFGEVHRARWWDHAWRSTQPRAPRPGLRVVQSSSSGASVPPGQGALPPPSARSMHDDDKGAPPPDLPPAGGDDDLPDEGGDVPEEGWGSDSEDEEGDDVPPS